MNPDELDAMQYAIKAAEMAASFRFALSVPEPRQHTLYCIGGSLDGQIHPGAGEVLVVPIWEPPHTRPRYREERYEMSGFASGEHVVYFWGLIGLRPDVFLSRARELYVPAAVLQDEQLICE